MTIYIYIYTYLIIGPRGFKVPRFSTLVLGSHTYSRLRSLLHVATSTSSTRLLRLRHAGNTEFFACKLELGAEQTTNY